MGMRNEISTKVDRKSTKETRKTGFQNTGSRIKKKGLPRRNRGSQGRTSAAGAIEKVAAFFQKTI